MSHSLDNQASQLTGFDYGNGVSAAYDYSAQRHCFPRPPLDTSTPIASLLTITKIESAPR